MKKAGATAVRMAKNVLRKKNQDDSDDDLSEIDSPKSAPDLLPFDASNSFVNKIAKMKTQQPQMLRDESVLKRFDAYEWSSSRSRWIKGSFQITNFGVRFTPTDISTYDEIDNFVGSFIPLLSIQRVEKFGKKKQQQQATTEHALGVELWCKDVRMVKFSLKDEARKKVLKFFRTIPDPHTFFAYKNSECRDDEMNGWKLYDPKLEFQRQLVPEDKWRFESNLHYSKYETYPVLFVVPTVMCAASISCVAKYRSKGRIPALTWFHARTRASLTRAAQPLPGLMKKQEEEDQRMLECIAQANESVQKLLILDLRPKANAVANQFLSGGFEDTTVYNNCTLQFLDIPNIHVMRTSQKKLYDLCVMSGGLNPKWWSSIEASGWLEHLHQLLFTSHRVATSLDRDKTSVLVHCSDGWDRTAQVVSLTQLILDPYFRTMDGFATLVEKDWLSFGHRFRYRMGHGSPDFWDGERSPIFLMFLDCVHQLVHQFPTRFQFNDDFLVFIADNIYSCRFGTFLHDSERERHYDVPDVRDTTPSIWTHLLSNRDNYINLFYDPSGEPIWPCYHHSSIMLWDSYWLRYSRLVPAPQRETEMTGIHLAVRTELETLIQLKLELQQEFNALARKNAKQKAKLEQLASAYGVALPEEKNTNTPSASCTSHDCEPHSCEGGLQSTTTTSNTSTPRNNCDQFITATLRHSVSDLLSRANHAIHDTEEYQNDPLDGDTTSTSFFNPFHTHDSHKHKMLRVGPDYPVSPVAPQQEGEEERNNGNAFNAAVAHAHAASPTLKPSFTQYPKESSPTTASPTTFKIAFTAGIEPDPPLVVTTLHSQESTDATEL